MERGGAFLHKDLGVKKQAASEPAPPRRLIHHTPLRYPGGKAKLAAFVKKIIEQNDLVDGQYAEPYAGGAGIALELLFHEYVSRVHINDISRPVFAFWKSVLDHTDHLAKLIRDTRPAVAEWDKQKRILSHPDDHDDLKLGFATFFLNRTNRSGILNGGIIGGRDQTGPWKIDARYNAPELIFRIESIANLRGRISLSCEDAVDFLQTRVGSLPAKTLVYLDPPYYKKGKDLYLDYYTPDDHERIAQFVTKRIRRQKWIVSYDNVSPIHSLYSECNHITYELGYSARDVRAGSEVMFFCDRLEIPAPVGAMKALAA